MSDQTATDTLAALGLLPPAPPASATRVVSARVISATSDVALLRVEAPGARSYDAIMPRTEFYPNKRWELNVSYTLEQLGAGPRPVLSAVRDEFIELLLAGVSPEVRAGQVRVVAVARECGNRTKLAVAATEPGVDAVASCVGRDANRVKYLRDALCGERVDVVAWHPDRETFLRNALAPAAVTELRFDGDNVTAVVPSHQMAAAVGGGGLNSRLAAQLAGVTVTVTRA